MSGPMETIARHMRPNILSYKNAEKTEENSQKKGQLSLSNADKEHASSSRSITLPPLWVKAQAWRITRSNILFYMDRIPKPITCVLDCPWLTSNRVGTLWEGLFYPWCIATIRGGPPKKSSPFRRCFALLPSRLMQWPKGYDTIILFYKDGIT